MERYRQQILFAFGYVCYVTSVIFFCVGVGVMVLLVHTLIDSSQNGMSAALMIPFGLILMVMAAAIFNLGRNIHNPSPPEETDE